MPRRVARILSPSDVPRSRQPCPTFFIRQYHDPSDPRIQWCEKHTFEELQAVAVANMQRYSASDKTRRDVLKIVYQSWDAYGNPAWKVHPADIADMRTLDSDFKL